ncbi:nucleoside/nucleotide kinase family protein [Nocardia mangyaensis]|uniref:Nucleoside/nucleotide kinase family protein n=1 Tax=Nocardia mangyaensis TaxID=2213200 RepID=A0A1J0VZ19_9NOCA|nr:nucleoside/nucleotide kinase family protein [Nocardia mangyaensis]APE37245.1 nucleoside/nucleotide kinase family protein [Nocardia mangyaensis]
MNRASGLLSVAELARSVPAVTAQRYLLGIAGPPGAGKSTLAQRLRTELTRAGRAAVVAPMDGYHLRNEVLRARGALARKGEPDTFDAAGFVADLRLLRQTPVGEPVPWPLFDRAIDEPTEGGVVVRDEQIVVIEGNYLLLTDEQAPGWAAVRGLLDACWYLDAPRAVLTDRLLDRHLAGARTRAEASAKVAHSDLRNADLVAASRPRADEILTAVGDGYLVH